MFSIFLSKLNLINWKAKREKTYLAKDRSRGESNTWSFIIAASPLPLSHIRRSATQLILFKGWFVTHAHRVRSGVLFLSAALLSWVNVFSVNFSINAINISHTWKRGNQKRINGSQLQRFSGVFDHFDWMHPNLKVWFYTFWKLLVSFYFNSFFYREIPFLPLRSTVFPWSFPIYIYNR